MPGRPLYIATILTLISIVHQNNAWAQVKRITKDSVLQPVPQNASKDSIVYLDPKTGKPKIIAGKQPEKNPAKRKPDTIIYIDNGKPRQAPTTSSAKPGKPVDTVIVLKKGRQKTILQEVSKKRDSVRIQRVPESCSCMTFTIKAPDTLHMDDYVNYSFVLKNNCKDLLWVNSASFSFFVFNPDGTPVRVLRKLQFVKQYRYPDFVQVSPGEEYTFEFADDPFFQYELRPYWKYKFMFGYLNSSRKYKGAPNKTYLCREFKDKTIAIADKVRPRK
ncbi:hypothetical protein [Polluticoccus soli]|uniref:hypothetical protein n=1 Tax=Polluticoccus soli TaxID=3034150 RepID=UPI0023E1F650|nr:hypothetical protein [Flavipsychrobacter sp. JY13-12]